MTRLVRRFGRRALAFAVVAVVAVAIPAASADHPDPIVPGPATFPQKMQRIVAARVLHTRLEVVRNTNARRIGRSLASLHPSWISGMIRYAKGQHPKRDEVHAWREITRIVGIGNPGASFDVTLNAKQYHDGREIQRMMHRIRTKLNPDGWFFDFYSRAYKKRPRMIRAAIANAHAHGEWIGGNIFGIRRKRPLPMRSDFFAIQDFRLRLNLRAVARLGGRVPLIYHLENDPIGPGAEGASSSRT